MSIAALIALILFAAVLLIFVMSACKLAGEADEKSDKLLAELERRKSDG